MSLQDRLDAFRENFEAGGPPYNAPQWVHEAMHREQYLMAEERAHRRFAGILAADVAGCSALMEADA
jgi:hypothetical protein